MDEDPTTHETNTAPISNIVDQRDRPLMRRLFALVIALWVVALVFFLLWHFKFASRVEGGNLGPVGDSFAILNTLFSGGALVFVALTGLMQQRELKKIDDLHSRERRQSAFQASWSAWCEADRFFAQYWYLRKYFYERGVAWPKRELNEKEYYEVLSAAEMLTDLYSGLYFATQGAVDVEERGVHRNFASWMYDTSDGYQTWLKENSRWYHVKAIEFITGLPPERQEAAGLFGYRGEAYAD